MSKCVRTAELELTQTIIDFPVASPVLFWSDAAREWKLARIADVRDVKDVPMKRPDLVLVDCAVGLKTCLEWTSTANVRPLFIDYVSVHQDWRPAVAAERAEEDEQSEYIFLEEMDLVSSGEFADEDVWPSDPDLRRSYPTLAQEIEQALLCLHKRLAVVVRKAQRLDDELDYDRRETYEYMRQVVIPVLEERGFLSLDRTSTATAFMNSLLQESRRAVTAAKV